MDVASLLIGTGLGGIVSWAVTAYFHSQASDDLTRKLDDHRRQDAKKDTLEYFQAMLVQGKWRKEYLDERETWICEENANLRMVLQEASEPFVESWTRSFPDGRGMRCEVELKTNGSTIKSLTFIHLDGHRILVPMPRIIPGKQDPIYFWEKDSLEYKVVQVIGDYYIHESIEGVANIAGVSVVYGQQRS